MANSEIIDFPLLTALTGAQLYGVKNDTDYRIKVGEANGLATLDATGKLPAGQAPATLWGTITGTLSNQLDLQAALNGKQAAGSYAAAVHTHTIGDVTGLQAALDGKQAAGSYAAASHTHTAAQITDLSSFTGFDARYYTEAEVNSLLAGKQAAGSYAAAVHTHVIGDVSGLQAALDGKQAAGSYAAAVHTHAIGDVTGLQAALDAKLDDSQATATGLDILNSANQDDARDAIGVYVQATDPGAVADGSLWIW